MKHGIRRTHTLPFGQGQVRGISAPGWRAGHLQFLPVLWRRKHRPLRPDNVALRGWRQDLVLPPWQRPAREQDAVEQVPLAGEIVQMRCSTDLARGQLGVAVVGFFHDCFFACWMIGFCTCNRNTGLAIVGSIRFFIANRLPYRAITA